jgi:hypothetical protein
LDSTWLDIFIGGVVAILAIALMGGLLYVSIFRAKEWNYPNMARGFGIGFLGLIIVGISELAKSEGAGDWASYIQTSGVVIGVVGFLWFIFGMGQD